MYSQLKTFENIKIKFKTRQFENMKIYTYFATISYYLQAMLTIIFLIIYLFTSRSKICKIYSINVMLK